VDLLRDRAYDAQDAARENEALEEIEGVISWEWFSDRNLYGWTNRGNRPAALTFLLALPKSHIGISVKVASRIFTLRVGSRLGRSDSNPTSLGRSYAYWCRNA